jgi:hypothetical protein
MINIFRKNTIFILVLMGILNLSIAPSYAVFGLSKCEKVKKQVLANEVGESFYQAAFLPANGAKLSTFSYEDYLFYTEIWSGIVDWEVSMYSFESKYLGCFTPAQVMFIVKAKANWDADKALPTHGVTQAGFPSVTWGSIYNQ